MFELVLNIIFLFLQIWNHPDVLYEALQKENQANEQDLDLDDITSASNPHCPTPGAGLKAKVADSSNSKVNSTLPPLNPSQDKANQVITYEWVCHVNKNPVQMDLFFNSDFFKNSVATLFF